MSEETVKLENVALSSDSDNADSDTDDKTNNSLKTPKFSRKKFERQNAKCEGMEVIYSKDRLIRIDDEKSAATNQENKGIFGFIFGLCCAQDRDAQDNNIGET